jgi:uncharacterized delta-60 repeat protein
MPGVRGRVAIGLLTVVMVAWPGPARAASGDLDASFGGDGRVLVQGSADTPGPGVALDGFGRIVIASATATTPTDIEVVRLLTDGSPDPAFGSDGTALIHAGDRDDRATAVAVQRDGGIVVAGTSKMHLGTGIVVARLLEDGSPDQSFSGNGYLRVHIGSGNDRLGGAVLQPDGDIIVAATAPFRHDRLAVLRYLSDGSPDTTFGVGGVRIVRNGRATWAGRPALQPNGRIVVAATRFGPGPDLAAVRLRAGGPLDKTFGGDGVVETQIQPAGYGTGEYGSGVAIRPDGSIVVAGNAYLDDYAEFHDCAVVAWTSDGALDRSFSSNGKLFFGWGYGDDWCTNVAVMPSGTLALAGTGGASQSPTERFGFPALTPHGRFVSSFGKSGKVTVQFTLNETDLTDSVVDADGRLVGVGYLAAAPQPSIGVARILGP